MPEQSQMEASVYHPSMAYMPEEIHEANVLKCYRSKEVKKACEPQLMAPTLLCVSKDPQGLLSLDG